MKYLAVVLTAMIFLAGCTCYLSPELKDEIAYQSAMISALSDRCQHDPNLCCEGLKAARDTLDLILDTANGVNYGGHNGNNGVNHE